MTTSSVERWVERRATTDREAFVRGLGGVGVLVRLDERGGRDEPAPWAFHGGSIHELMSEADTISADEDEDDVLIRPRPTFKTDEVTLTSAQAPLSVPAARGQATVHVVPAPKAGGEVVIGRAQGCDVVVPERSVSKRHAKIVAAADGLRVVDLGSSNGLAVNGKRKDPGAPAPLRSGDVVEFGDVSTLFLDPATFWDHLPKMAG